MEPWEKKKKQKTGNGASWNPLNPSNSPAAIDNETTAEEVLVRRALNMSRPTATWQMNVISSFHYTFMKKHLSILHFLNSCMCHFNRVVVFSLIFTYLFICLFIYISIYICRLVQLICMRTLEWHLSQSLVLQVAKEQQQQPSDSEIATGFAQGVAEKPSLTMFASKRFISFNGRLSKRLAVSLIIGSMFPWFRRRVDVVCWFSPTSSTKCFTKWAELKAPVTDGRSTVRAKKVCVDDGIGFVCFLLILCRRTSERFKTKNDVCIDRQI